jgi:hypothetical protein
MKNLNLKIVFLLLEKGVDIKFMNEEQQRIMEREALLKDVISKFRKVAI